MIPSSTVVPYVLTNCFAEKSIHSDSDVKSENSCIQGDLCSEGNIELINSKVRDRITCQGTVHLSECSEAKSVIADYSIIIIKSTVGAEIKSNNGEIFLVKSNAGSAFAIHGKISILSTQILCVTALNVSLCDSSKIKTMKCYNFKLNLTNSYIDDLEILTLTVFNESVIIPRTTEEIYIKLEDSLTTALTKLALSGKIKLTKNCITIDSPNIASPSEPKKIKGKLITFQSWNSKELDFIRNNFFIRLKGEKFILEAITERALSIAIDDVLSKHDYIINPEEQIPRTVTVMGGRIGKIKFDGEGGKVYLHAGATVDHYENCSLYYCED